VANTKVTAAQAAANATTLVANKAALDLIAGVSGVLYVTLDNGYLWRWNGTTYVGAPFTIDDSGNIVLTVLNQTNTLANLLTLSGGNGKIAIANDQDALVVYHGGVTDGKAFYRRPKRLVVCINTSSVFSCPSGVDTLVIPDGIDRNDGNIMDAATGYITIPAGYSIASMQVLGSAAWNDAAVASSSLRKIMPKYESGPGSGLFTIPVGANNVANSVASVLTRQVCNGYIGTFFIAAGSRLGIFLNQASGVALIPTLNLTIILESV